MPGPVFKSGERVDLCPPEMEDVDFLLGNRNDPAVRQWFPAAHPDSRSDVEEFIEDPDEDDDGTRLLAVVDGVPVGSIGLFRVSNESGRGYLGAWIDPEYHGQGYGTEMTELMIEYAFDERRLHTLAAGALATNDRSRGLLEKVGFEQEGQMREAYYVDGEYVDRVLYGLHEDDWE